MSLAIKQIPQSSSSSLEQGQHFQASRDPLGVCTRAVASLRIGGVNDGILVSPDNPNLVHQNLFIKAIAQLTFSFLRPNELAPNTRVCRYWEEIINSEITWKLQCGIQGFPERLPEGISYKRVIKDFYPSMFGKDFYKKYIGDVGVVPTIPENFITRAYLADSIPDPMGKPEQLVKDNFVLVLDPPGPITIEINADSTTVLDENGNLTEQAPSTPSKDECKKDGSKKVLRVDSTINNIGMVAAKHLKKGIITGFSHSSWRMILEHHGDKRSPSGWSYQRKSVVGLGLSYPAQEELAANAGLEVVSLKARVVFNIMTKIRSGMSPDAIYVANTSTVTLDSIYSIPIQSAVWWVGSGSSARLSLTFGDALDPVVGAAVGVPAESSKAIGLSLH